MVKLGAQGSVCAEDVCPLGTRDRYPSDPETDGRDGH